MLNALLRKEAWARDRLQQHVGKTVGFALGPWAARFAIQADGCVQVSDPAVVPDVTLSVSSDKLARLPSALQARDPQQVVALMHIQGDAGLAQAVSDLAAGLRWDVEDDLSRLVGDMAAVRIIKGFKAASGSTRRSALRLGQNVSEYLSEESGQILGRPVFDDWSAQLQAARQSLQRLEQRMADLEARPVAGQTLHQTPPC